MENWKNESEAREQIKNLVTEYYHDFKEKKDGYKEGDRITYAARVFDEKEMCALTDATLDFWLTTGRFADQFEKQFAEWIGVKYAHLVNSGSSANLIAFMTLQHQSLENVRLKRVMRLSLLPVDSLQLLHLQFSMVQFQYLWMLQCHSTILM